MSQENLPSGVPWRPRLRWLGTVAAIVAAIIIVSLIAGCSSSKGGASKPNITRATGTDAEVALLLAGIPQRGNILGDPKAPVTLEYFGDLECPFCRRFTLEELPSLIHSYVRSGKLKIEYRSLETATRDPETFNIQQLAALAAGKQNKMWNFIELFYHEQGEEDSGYVTESYLQGLARQVPGLHLIAWTADRSDTELANTIISDARAASNAGLTRTPSFLIVNPSSMPYASVIEKLLKE